MNGAGKKRAIQFLYVLRKNFLLQWRRPISTTLELLCPLIAIIVLIIVRHTVPQFAVKKQCFITFDSDHLVIPYTGSYNIYFAPNSTEAKEVASIVQSRLPGSTFIPTKNQDEFITNIQKDVDMRDRGCFINGTGIFFNNITNKDMVYTLRLRHETPTKAFGFNKWYTRLRSPGIQPTGPRVYDNAYLNEGFLHLEHIVGLALIEWKTGQKPDLPPVSVRQLPYPPFDDDEFLVNIDFILPFFLMAAFLVSAGFLTKELVLEKETRMREMMRMMGLSQGVLWVTWFIKQFLFLLLPFVVLGILFWGGKIFPKSNVFALLLFMVVFLLSLLSFCFLVSVWFDDSRLGLMAGFIFWFLTYFPHLFLAFFYDTLPLSVKIVSCLLSNTCMGLAVNVISLLELRGDGLQFSNYGSPLSLDDQFSMLIITAMLLVDSIIYLLIAWYINEVKPGQYGIPRKPYFFLQSTYWTGKPSLCCKRRTVTPFSNEDVDHHDIDENDDHDLSVHELITPEPQAGIEITNLHKKFKPRLYSRQSLEVVNIQKLKIYKGQITALLGHNGAGKTTTMSILTGLFPPTSGSVIVNGHSVTNEIDKVRQDLGVCPQVNVLFDRMTVNEHLWYFTKLKNIKGTEASDAINDMLSRMDLERNKNKRVLELSGGNKRKLSVAIAMIGNPSVVILDEPTSGMDNNARQMTWNLLRDKAATNRTTILVSTHSIDDTEMADRIVIMVHGKIKCSGRPPFLKEKYKVGYNLRIQLSEESDPQLLEDTIKRHVKKYWVYSFVHHHEYTLPYDEMKSFPYLFGALEARKKELGIISFSMQENSMEDVFISSKEGRLLSANDEHRQRTASIHNPSTLPQSPSWMTATTPSSPSLLNFPDSSAQFQGFFQSAPQSPKMDVIAEESSGVETSSSQLQEDIDGPMANVLPGFPAVDQSYNAKDYYKKSHFSFSGLSSGGLQQIQQSMVAGQHESTPRLGHVGFVNRSRSSSGANESIPSGERRFGMLSRTTVGRNQTLSRSRPLIGRPSILNDIIDLDEKDEEHEEDGESLWAREAEEAVDFGHGKYDVEQLVSPEPQDNIQNRCNLLSLSAKMWLQQYKAMFLKRWYNFKRFLPALIWQLLLPLVFVILGLVLAAVIPASHDEDPLRKMSLDSSAPSETRTIFWSQHSSANLSSIPFTMQDLENPLYGLTNKKVENYTLGVVNLYEEVQTGRSVEDCCNYTFQLLDKYCATRKKNEIVEKCSSDEEFGYHDCLNRCFSCCEARHHQLPSCSNPRFQQLCDISCYPNVSQFCSAPPKLSLGDFQNPEGPLDDMNAFVAEYILQSAANNTASYYQHVLGGFSIVEEQPAYSVCGCEDGKGEDGSCPGSLNQLELMNSGLMSEESPAIPPLPIFCDDNATTIAETLGVSISGLVEVPATSSNASSTFQVIPSVKSHVLLSMLPSCQSVDNMTSFCLDGSCHADKQCNTSNQSLASQYGNIINQGRTSITVWYNNQPYHVSPSILNVLHNLYLRGNESFANHSITVYNHPLPRRPMSTVGAVESDLLSFVVGAASILGSSFLLASFSTFIVQEKSSKAKHLQMASGLQLTAYWVANLTADLIIALLFVLSSLVLFAIFQPFVPAYSGQALAAVLLLLVLLCWSSTPLVYFISLAFQNIYTAFTVILIMFFMTSLICLALLYIVGVLANFRDEADIFYYIFIFHPGFGFAAALSDLYIANVYQDACVQSNLTRTICDQIGVDYTTGPFEFFRPGCGAIITVLAAEGFLFFLLTILVDHWSQILQFIQSKKKRRYPIKKRDLSSLLMTESRRFSTSNFGRLPRSLSAMSRAFFETVDDEETDVEAILSQDTIDPQYTVLVYDMEKNYHTEQYCSSLTENANVRPAVNGLIFKVEAGECFGLLGVNGAGKSTTFKILTGDISMTSGTAIIAGYDIRTQLRQVQQRIGYCPQFDALIERLTGRELLTMFARLRGIQEKDIKKEVDDKLERLQLSIHADKECWKYSGGNKRKLSTAIALIGDTKVIFLDEPTTGMDIDTRKHFITTLQNVVQEENRSIVLTSHSMAECEALCNRIGIMVDGKFKCIGSKEVLKDQYGEKFTKLMIRVQSTSAAADAASAATAAVAGSRHQSVEEVDYAGNRRMSSALSRIQHTISRQGQRILNLARRGQSRGAGSREEVDAVLEDTSIQRVQQAVLHTFSGRIADQDPIDVQNDSITFQLPKNSVPLSEIFDVMERLHRDTSLGIVGYSVSQSTLNQVFNRIVNGHQDRANSIP